MYQKIFIRGVSHWGHVSSLEKGKIYAGGTIGSFQALTGWKVHFGAFNYMPNAIDLKFIGWKSDLFW